MKIHIHEAQDDLSSLLIAVSMFHNSQESNFAAMTNVVTHRLPQELPNLANRQMQDIYSLPPGSYTAPVESITAPPPGQEPVTPTLYQSVLMDKFLDIPNGMQRREQDL